MICEKCGRKNISEAYYCINCGFPLVNTELQKKEKVSIKHYNQHLNIILEKIGAKFSFVTNFNEMNFGERIKIAAIIIAILSFFIFHLNISFSSIKLAETTGAWSLNFGETSRNWVWAPDFTLINMDNWNAESPLLSIFSFIDECKHVFIPIFLVFLGILNKTFSKWIITLPMIIISTTYILKFFVYAFWTNPGGTTYHIIWNYYIIPILIYSVLTLFFLLAQFEYRPFRKNNLLLITSMTVLLLFVLTLFCIGPFAVNVTTDAFDMHMRSYNWGLFLYYSGIMISNCLIILTAKVKINYKKCLHIK